MVGKENVDLAIRSCLYDVTSLLENGIFWEKYKINRSPGDGHCLLHSIISSMAFQIKTIITLSELIQAIISETISNSSEYDFINGPSSNLWSGLTAYVDEKIYDTLFGDLVPHIIANAIYVNIIIVRETESREYTTLHVPCTRVLTESNVVIYKKGKHYDGIQPDVSEHTKNDCHSLREDAAVAQCRDKAATGVNGSMRGSVKILSMNICGISDWKLADDIFGLQFKRFDIILLQETWSAEGDDFCLEGYEFHNFPRKNRHKWSVRNSGGLGIFVNHNLTEGIHVLKHHEDMSVWLKLDKHYFGLAKDLLIANVYVVPENSVHLCHDAFDLLREDLCGFTLHSDCLICGDFNARTNVLPDYLDEYLCGNDGNLPIFETVNDRRSLLLRKMAENNELDRFSKDSSRTNKHGRNLLEFCKTAGLLIMNGRLGSDKGIGELTRVDTTGCSVVDYMLCNPDLFSQITHFGIELKVPESDHCGLSLTIKCDKSIKYNEFDNESDWIYHNKYLWSRSDLETLKYVLADNQSLQYRQELIDALVELEDTNQVASLFCDYITQAVDRVCRISSPANRVKRNGAPWFDMVCRYKRSLAIQAGHRVECAEDRQLQIEACQDYRAHKQRKRREHFKNCVLRIVHTYESDRSKLWKTIETLSQSHCQNTAPSGNDFLEHFKSMSDSQTNNDFSSEYESVALAFLRQYDYEHANSSSLEHHIINDNVTVEEVDSAIDYLKNGKSPGMDCIPAEFIKSCKSILSSDITNVLNYIIGVGNFPTQWAEGLRSAVFKSGSRMDTDNYRGITVLPIMEKIFEIIVYRRLSFANEAFNKIDRYNGGFLVGSRTSDNIFILQGLIQRQLCIGSNLIVCFVDFSKAFDLINRHILFYKIMKGGWYGPVIDTLRNLYDNTSFRVKSNSRVSTKVISKLGVNQGGVASGLLFRKYIADLDSYLSTEHGVCIGNEIVAHLLWADDLILFSDTFHGLQKQLHGLKKFCSINHMIVNEMKTKVMIFGNPKRSKLYFNENVI